MSHVLLNISIINIDATKAEWRLNASDIGITTTAAGTGDPNYNGDNIPAIEADLKYPECVVVDTLGNLYIADTVNSRIRKVTKTTGIITTIAGTGEIGYNGDNIAATSATLYFPSGIAVDLTGDIYIADTSNNRLRIVSKKTGMITTVAGNGSPAFSGDNMQSTLSAIHRPYSIAIDASRNIYFADSLNFRVRMVNITTGIITTVAGNSLFVPMRDNVLASTTTLSDIRGICFDSIGNLFIADWGNDRIRMVDKNTGIITTVAGTETPGYNGDHIPATSARLNTPGDIAVDASGNLYIADTANYRVRMVTKSTGIITTIVGTGSTGTNIDGKVTTKSPTVAISSIALTPQGDLFITDYEDSKILHVKLWKPPAVPTSKPIAVLPSKSTIIST